MSLADADALYTGTTSELAGQAVSGAGDVDGDGFLDMLVGAPAHADLVSRKGSIYIVFGTGP